MGRDRKDHMDGLAPGWRIERCEITDPDAATLVAAVQREYVARYGTADETPLEPGYFSAPSGAFFVGYLAGRPVATGGWHLRSDVTALGSSACAEVKRMYVDPGGRRQGVARAMLAHLEQTAAQAGAQVVILETGTEQPEALALYAGSGYEPIPGFGYYRDSPLNRCFARAVEPGLPRR